MTKYFLRLCVLAVTLSANPCFAITPAPTRKDIESHGLRVARELCVDDLSCKTLIESYETESDDGKPIVFRALCLYIQQTLAPKLPTTPETTLQLRTIASLFEAHTQSSPDAHP